MADIIVISQEIMKNHQIKIIEYIATKIPVIMLEYSPVRIYMNCIISKQPELENSNPGKKRMAYLQLYHK